MIVSIIAALGPMAARIQHSASAQFTGLSTASTRGNRPALEAIAWGGGSLQDHTLTIIKY